MPIPEIVSARAAKFLECWRTKNAEGCLSFLQLTWAAKQSRRSNKQTMRSRFDLHPLIEYELEKFSRTMAVCDVEASVKFEAGGAKRLCFRMVCEDAPYQPNSEGTGKWGINPTSIRIEELPNENATDSQAEAR